MARDTRTGGREATTAVIPGSFGLSVGDPGTRAPAGFAWRALSDLARLESGHTPSRNKPDYWDGCIPWIGIRDASGNHGKVLTDTEQHVTQLGLDNSSARLLPSGTVCLSRTASVGYVVTLGRPMATSQDFVNWVCGPELDHRYLHYLLMAEQDTIRRIAYGSVHPTMYYPDAKALHVCIPGIHEQVAIAEVLGALDDKITVNAKSASLVDELLSTRFAQLSAGREFTHLRSIASLNQRSTKPKVGGKLRYLDISSVGRGTYDFPSESSGEDAPGRARRLISRGDVVWSTVRPNRRSHALVLDDDDELVGSTGLAVLTPEPGRTAALYEAVRTERFVAYLETVAEGSAYPAVRAERFLDAPVPDLESKEWDRFEELAMPLRDLVHAMTVESRRLALTRDELLPLLMSAKVRVKDAEKPVEGVL
jgi:type I restriction enzyme, S subunit